MATNDSRKVFINLAVRDLQRSMDFFKQLGFVFNPNFTDQNAACMVISDYAFVMLLVEKYFKTFTKRQICDTNVHSEGLFAISCNSRAEVDDVLNKAIGAGGKHAMDPLDHGFMYVRSFYDLDGHHWEVMWMDPKAVPA